MAIGYGASTLFAVSHTYWVLLTVVTILKPVYNVTRKRNIQRVLGTLGGIVAASIILFLVSDTTALLILLIGSMLMAYSLLRINYLGFVIFLTVYIIITFHFLNPVEFKHLIGERLIDTFIGSVIAALAARFIFPVWEHENIRSAMQEVLEANRSYFLTAWRRLTGITDDNAYNKARTDAIVALTNLSDNFQQMLAEPGQGKASSHIHQFVIASHALTSRIAVLSSNDLRNVSEEVLATGKETIADALNDSIKNLNTGVVDSGKSALDTPSKFHSTNPVSIIYSLARDLRTITQKMVIAKE
jgi:uncharacterized membrane protein YccC